MSFDEGDEHLAVDSRLLSRQRRQVSRGRVAYQGSPEAGAGTLTAGGGSLVFSNSLLSPNGASLSAAGASALYPDPNNDDDDYEPIPAARDPRAPSMPDVRMAAAQTPRSSVLTPGRIDRNRDKDQVFDDDGDIEEREDSFDATKESVLQMYRRQVRSTTIAERPEAPYLKLFKKVAFYFLGAILLFLSTSAFWLPRLVETNIRKTLKSRLIFDSVDESNEFYRDWVRGGGSDIKVYYEVRYMNVTNAIEVLSDPNVLPQLEILPPIVFDDNTHKCNVSFNEDGTEVTYKAQEYFVYNEELSQLKRDERVVIIAPYVGLLYDSLNNPNNGPLEKLLIQDVIDGLNQYDPYHITYIDDTAENALFAMINQTFTGLRNSSNQIHVEVGLGQNHSTCEESPWETTKTGKDDVSQLAWVTMYDGSRDFDCWDPPARLASHDLLYGLFNSVTKDKSLPTFVGPVYRNVNMEFNYTTHYNGIKLYRFYVGVEQFYNVSMDPSMEQWDQWGPIGTINLTRCSNGLPIYVSLPLFIGGPDYMATLDQFGLRQPSIDEYSFADVEPFTGLLFRANKSLQINFPIVALNVTHPFSRLNVSNNNDNDNHNHEHSDNESLTNLPKEYTLTPVMITSQTFTMPQKHCNDILEIYAAKSFKNTWKLLAYLCWIPFSMWAFYILYHFGKRDQKAYNELLMSVN